MFKIKKTIEYVAIFAVMAAIIGIIAFEACCLAPRTTPWYIGRSLLLSVLGVMFVFLCYRIVKQRKRFSIRTLPEIIDDILEGSLWKQLGYLFLLSLVAFFFSWLFVDALSPEDQSCSDEIVNGHNTFWLTVCYFFDAGNLNITPADRPGWQWVISMIVAVLGMTLLTGLLISTFTNVLETRVEQVQAGLVTYKKIHGHHVVIGYCELTEAVVRGLLKSDDTAKVIVLTNHDMAEVRTSLLNLKNSEEYDGRVVLYAGDYRMEKNLHRLNLPVAKSVYVLGDDEMQSRDYENLSAAQKISDICEKSEEDEDPDNPVVLYVRMDRMPSFSTLQRLDIDRSFFSEKVYFRPFNYYEHWARTLWTKRQIVIDDVTGGRQQIDYPSLFYDKTEEGRNRYVHLVVSGFSEMGMSLTLQAIRLAHYGNYQHDKRMKTWITVVDPQMDTLKPSFLAQFRHLDQIYDIDLDFRTCRLEDMDEELVQWSMDKEQMLTLAICLGDADAALSQALSLPLEFYYQHGRHSDELPRILVRQNNLSGIWNMLKGREHNELLDVQADAQAFRKGKYNKYRHLYPFGMLISSLYPEDMDDLKACLMHIDYEDTWGNGSKTEEQKITIKRLYDLAQGGSIDSLRNLIDLALARWYKIPENIKWSNRYQTDIHRRLKDILHNAGIDSPDQINDDNAKVFNMCSDIEHRRWVAERVVAGWQQSPCLKDGKPMRQDALLLHIDITPNIGEEKKKDEAVVRNILKLDTIYELYKNAEQ